ncbi:MAG: hypothetical protein PVH46_07350 [Granulosicoccaceae bacterium]|jgi:hypothetical protein
MMHDGGWMTFGFGLGHWGFGLLIWIAIIAGIVWLVKSLGGPDK